MTCYRVVWEIDIEADSPKEAAEEALRIQRDPESIATVFTVQEGPIIAGEPRRSHQIDLTP